MMLSTLLALLTVINTQGRFSVAALEKALGEPIKNGAFVEKPATPTVFLMDCEKCPVRFRLAPDGRWAAVNLARLFGTDKHFDETMRDAAALIRRADGLLVRSRPPENDKRRPLMGWSSWNTFGVDISEEIILSVAQAMATNGLKDAGYTYVNIDDGFFYGHGPDGKLRFHPQRFPRGMKPTVDGIHKLGLKAGIYSDAGADTCGSMWGGSGSAGKDKGGIGGGLYGHDAADCKLHFNELGFDFIKVDYCGGGKLGLDEKARYTEIAKAIRATGRTDVRLNLCRWAFPGTWAADIAESWRTTGDIRANWKSVKKLTAENLYLSAFAKPGHFNDMDMLEVGQLTGQIKTVFGDKHGDTGLTVEEEACHFGMWCMLSSPLLIGCDVRSMPAASKELVTNPYLLSMSQNDLGLQGYVVARDGETYVLAKDAGVRFGTSRFVALYNAEDKPKEFRVSVRDLELGGLIQAIDLRARADEPDFRDTLVATVPPHGAKFYRLDAEKRLERPVYEAETAYLSDYQELKDAVKAVTAHPYQATNASGRVAVCSLGTRPSNDLIWKDVRILDGGKRTLEFVCSSEKDAPFFVEIDGGAPAKVDFRASGKGIFATAFLPVELKEGVHAVRLSNPDAPMPEIDYMVVR